MEMRRLGTLDVSAMGFACTGKSEFYGRVGGGEAPDAILTDGTCVESTGAYPRGAAAGDRCPDMSGVTR